MKNVELKRVIITLTVMLLSLQIFAQSPKKINYQAIARTGNGNVLSNQFIKVRFTIRDSSVTGNPIYKESDTATTNQFGLFATQLGSGTVLLGSFSAIDWAKGEKFLAVEFDATGGNTFTDMGTTQLISVPYALYADSAGKTQPQTLSLLSDTLHLTNGGKAYLGIYHDTLVPQTISLNHDTLSLSQGNQVVLPYNSMMNFVAKINGVRIDNPSIDDVMIDASSLTFVTETNYKYFMLSGYSPKLDTFRLYEEPVVVGSILSQNSGCSAPYYTPVGFGNSIRPGIVFYNTINSTLSYIPFNPTTVALTNPYVPNGGNCIQTTGTNNYYQILPNNPAVTGFGFTSNKLEVIFSRY